jgi:hypothetical protein
MKMSMSRVEWPIVQIRTIEKRAILTSVQFSPNEPTSSHFAQAFGVRTGPRVAFSALHGAGSKAM